LFSVELGKLADAGIGLEVSLEEACAAGELHVTGQTQQAVLIQNPDDATGESFVVYFEGMYKAGLKLFNYYSRPTKCQNK